MIGTPAMAAPTASISGTVVLPDGVDPAAVQVEVQLYVIDFWGDSRADTTETDSTGAFAFAELDPGQYKLHFVPLDVNEGVTAEWWEDAATADTATVIDLADGGAYLADPTLDPAASISGHVELPPSAGWNGGSAYIAVYPVDAYPGNPAAWTLTDPDGNYTAGGLAPGDYKVEFSGDSAREWWNNAPRFSAADVITLALGEAREGVDAELAEAGTISGTVTTDAGAPVDSGSWSWMVALPVADGGTPYTPGTTTFNAPIDADGRYSISYLPAGDYTVQFRWGCDCGGPDGGEPRGPWRDEFYSDATTVDEATVVTVAEGAAVDGIDFSLDPNLTGAAPTISGSAAVGSTLTAKRGTWTTGATFTYQWYASGAAIAGATRSTFAVTSAQQGKAISVAVTGSLTGGASLKLTSAATSKVPTTATPTISGTAAVGSTLTAKPGTWTSGTTFTYQWYADSTAISGATASAYKPTTAQQGKQISVNVTGKRSGYTAVSKTSAKTTKALLSATPTVSGTAAVGSTLTAKAGTWTSSTTLTYQWYANSSAISGATKSSYRLSNATAGKQISVKITGKRSGYTTVSKTSTRTAKVIMTATPTISGTAAVGSTLTAKSGTWTRGTAFSYQWLRNGVAISGATSATFRARPADAYAKISVKVTGKLSGHATATKTSASTAAVKGKAYANCTALNADYRDGIRKSGVKFDKRSGVNKPVNGSPYTSTELYNLQSPARDGDKDGIMCER
ncbi:hypothetical protein JOD63_002278 [Microbacterium terrae]|uniref:alpha-amylase n=1 Tax=Microbacterium terrae TaxID=69369 RepID=A0A0M2GZ72_9MICO|nr:excalibur calcium-binding domain-containing protein [Microbacterium terrae]KJL39402.1 Cna protein B-type domain protein [Microbacterium terrae]MBP1078310.1 hypothetical protein [Microbacterium terrae]GLJ97789.1 hypothetical protein GCM10017594_09860 [Microbacterium terrae]